MWLVELVRRFGESIWYGRRAQTRVSIVELALSPA
jgi:hypothetical protein